MIPKRIYQTWKTKELPNGIRLVIKRMMELNPTYTHYLYDDTEMDSFVNEHFNGPIADAYNQLNIGASRADMWRYLILYKYGGVYLDIDSAILKCLDTLIRKEDVAIITREQFNGLYNQWILIFKKGHPLLKAIIEQCVENINKRSSNNILHLTGSTVFTKVINKCLMDSTKEIKGHIWNTPDTLLETYFFEKEHPFRCRFYGIDMNDYAQYHSEHFDELYKNGTLQWEQEQKVKSIFKDGIKNKNEKIEKVEL
jgi:mannosyltransferase OCH1-like enzyme